jgi:two-component system response regulator AtoC
VADLPAALLGASGAGLGDAADTNGETTLRLQLRRYEVRLLQDAIRAAEGDRKVAAQRLGISLSSLYRKLGEAAS